MSMPAATAPTTATVRYEGLWLFSSRADLSLLLVPALLTAFSAWMASFTGEGLGGLGYSRAIGRWASQYILFNNTHVILTFLLLGVRRELLHTTPNQSRLLVGGSSMVGAGLFGLLWYAGEYAPRLNLVVAMGIHVFAAHHTLSQVKGLWSLHLLRARTGGLPAPAELERRMQRLFVPFALTLMMVRSLLVPAAWGGGGPLLDIGQSEGGLLPFETTWVLLGAWGVFLVLLGGSLRGPGGLAGPRRLYVMGHAMVVTVYLLWPIWGVILTAGIHGLEYALLTARMLEPREGEAAPPLRRRWVWPAMGLAMLPLLLVGVANSPFVPLLDSTSGGAATDFLLRQQPLWNLGVVATNACVLTHYFADAFMYRFRIAGIRDTTLGLLGMGGKPSAA